jgi:predicted MFS family arabinose efflux permease
MNERTIVLLVAAVQFVNILDFMIIMPLGPDFAAALDIPTSHIGYLGGVYTLAAAVSGVIGSRILDRFDRRTVLGLSMLGLILATAAGGFAVGMFSLLAARIVAGAFGGPATSIALAIVGDAVPPARRGKAIGTVMAAFSAASILGVPAGLEAARLFGWRAPFFSVAALGLVVLPFSSANEV